MCYATHVAKGSRRILRTHKEGRMRVAAPRRDLEKVAKQKQINFKKAQARSKKEKRIRRHKAKVEKEGMKHLRRRGLVRH